MAVAWSARAGSFPPGRRSATNRIAPSALPLALFTFAIHSSRRTEDAEDTFIFTDSTILVEQVLKDNPAGPIDPGDSIIETRPGGKLVLDGRKLRVRDTGFVSLRLAGRYMLVLRFIPQTGAHQPTYVDVTSENPDQKVLDQAREDLAGCRD